MRFRRVLAGGSLLAIVLLLAACQSTSFSYSGSWKGSILDSVAGPGTVTVSMTEAGSDIVGTWQAVFSSGSNGGSLTGVINGSSVVIDLEPSNTSACPYNVVANRSGSTVSGNYSAYNCTGTITGTLSITKQ